MTSTARRIKLVGLVPPAAIVILAWASSAAAQNDGRGAAPEATVSTHRDAQTPPKRNKHNESGFRWEDHPSLHFTKGTHIDFRVRLAGDVRDSAAPLEDEGDANRLDIPRRRVGVRGGILNLVDFEVDAELGASEVWRDVYANYRQFDVLQVQGGKFKLPFSLDENTSSANLDFVYRSRAASQLAPGRDIGFMVHGRLLNRTLGYEAGVFQHDGSNARTADSERVYGGQTLASRVTVQPFRGRNPLLSDLQFGVAFTRSGLGEGFSDLRGRTALDARFFRPDVWVNGERQRRGLEARWRPGPVSIKAEWLQVRDERRLQSVDDTDLSPLVATGWYVSGTWALTGEKKAAGVDRPRRPLFRGGYGAVEVAARIEQLEFGSGKGDEMPSDSPRADTIAGNTDRVVTFGANWYVNRWIKLQFNLMRDELADPSQGPLPSRSTFWSRVLRVQLAL